MPTVLMPIIVFMSGLLAGCSVPLKGDNPLQVSESRSAPVNASEPDNSVLVLESVNALPHQPLKPTTQIGRYRVIDAVPTLAQEDLLQVMVTLTLPREVKTVGAATAYLLARSGYRYREAVLSQSPLAVQAVKALLTKPIPAVHRHIGPMPLQSALKMLAGAPFELHRDPIHREVSFILPANLTMPGQP